MRQRGVLYDVGRAMSRRAMNWRPDYTPSLARRELEIIRTDLHANAVRICGLDLTRLITAAEDALAIGLDVWLSPELWGATPERTLRYLAEAAVVAEPLRRKWPDRIIFSVGNELTFFMPGIVPGRRFDQRTQLSTLRELVRTGAHTPPLRAFLQDATTAVRREYDGPVSYSALRFEDVDWDLFDVIGINYYLNTASAASYSGVLERLLATGKPVSVTEFGFPACEAADAPEMLRIGVNARPLSLIGQRIPLAGRLIRPHVPTIYPRDEAKQARLLAEQIDLLDQIGVDGAYIMSFSFPLSPHDPDPRRPRCDRVDSGPEPAAWTAWRGVLRHGLGAEGSISRGCRALSAYRGAEWSSTRFLRGGRNGFPIVERGGEGVPACAATRGS